MYNVYEMIPLHAIQEARARLSPFLTPSPVRFSESYSKRLGARVTLKLELLLPTHAFKVRGALNALLSLPDNTRDRGVVTASAGNHGLGLAYAGARTQTRVTVVLPLNTPQDRVNAIRDLGSAVVVHGEDWNEANTLARSLAETRGLVYVSPFDDPAVMAGQGTLGLELLEQAPDLDIVVVSVGGGGLISGVASAVKALKPEVRIIGVETAGADCMAQSLRAGRLVELPHFGSIAQSLGTKRSTERPFEIVRELVERVEVVPDEAALRDLITLLNTEKLLVEPAASCTLSALTEGLVPDLRGKTVAPVLCGGNVTLPQVLGWLEKFDMTPDGKSRVVSG